jgi:hypothetical protein
VNLANIVLDTAALGDGRLTYRIGIYLEGDAPPRGVYLTIPAETSERDVINALRLLADRIEEGPRPGGLLALPGELT